MRRRVWARRVLIRHRDTQNAVRAKKSVLQSESGVVSKPLTINVVTELKFPGR